MSEQHTGQTIRSLMDLVDMHQLEDDFCPESHCDEPDEPGDVLTTNGIEPTDEYERRTR